MSLAVLVHVVKEQIKQGNDLAAIKTNAKVRDQRIANLETMVGGIDRQVNNVEPGEIPMRKMIEELYIASKGNFFHGGNPVAPVDIALLIDCVEVSDTGRIGC